MSLTDPELESKQLELLAMRQQANELEAEILEASAAIPWRLTGFYTMYYATNGFLLGLIAAAVSLVFNVIGAPLAGKAPLELIRVYLTFPFGERALQLTDATTQVYAIDNGVILTCGVCLYLFTGMFLGVPFHVLLARFTARATTFQRILFAAALGIFAWAVLFYGVLVWLQPMVCGGNWIASGEYLPWWVAAATHVVFGVTMVFVFPFGQFVPYQTPPAPASDE